MKPKYVILLILLWNCFHSFAGSELPDKRPAYLYLKVPSNLKPNKYTYLLNKNYVNKQGSPSNCYYDEVYRSGQIIKCEILKGSRAPYEDTLVDVEFIVQSRKWGRDYYHHQVRLKITSDSTFYTIPDLPDDKVISSFMKENGTDYRNFKRRYDFVDFMTNWKSYLIFANFHQGNRPYGELSFSNARYTKSLGFIRGPVYGAEFNFLWRKNDFILGPKVGFQVTSKFLNFGLSGIYYTDLTHGLFCLKPRIGANPGIPWISFSYEYAIRCGYNYFGNRINSHQFSVYFAIPLRLKEY